MMPFINPDIGHSDHNQIWMQINVDQKWDLKKNSSDSSVLQWKKAVYTDFVPKVEDPINIIRNSGKKTPIKVQCRN